MISIEWHPCSITNEPHFPYDTEMQNQGIGNPPVRGEKANDQTVKPVIGGLSGTPWLGEVSLTVTANGEQFMISAYGWCVTHQGLTSPTLDSEMSGDDISHSFTRVANLLVNRKNLEAEIGKGEVDRFSHGWRCPDRRSEKWSEDSSINGASHE